MVVHRLGRNRLPRKKRAAFDRLEYIASRFDLIEINSTFYRTPARSTCRGWAERVSSFPDFLFTAKTPRDVTHGGRSSTGKEIAAFKTALEPLSEHGRLGAVLVQFPWSFRPTKEGLAYVKTVTDELLPFPAAVEVRHGEWAAPQITGFFHDNGIAMCGIDQPLIGNSLGRTFTSRVPASRISVCMDGGKTSGSETARAGTSGTTISTTSRSSRRGAIEYGKRPPGRGACSPSSTIISGGKRW